MKSQRILGQRMASIGRSCLFFLFVILVTALGVLCACEVAVRWPDGFTLKSAAFGGRAQALFALEVLGFSVLYGFTLWRNWRRTLRISVGMLGILMAFLSIAFYGFWLSHPSADLQTAGRNTALFSAGALVSFISWSVLARRQARRAADAVLNNEVTNECEVESMKNLRTVALAATCTAAMLASGAADAAGCIKGAVVGGVAGKLVGHPVLGAVGGCVYEHHHEAKLKKEQAQAARAAAAHPTAY